MLFLTRKPIAGQDTIVIGDDIKVVIRRVDGHMGNQVRVGIEAPKHVNIARQEVDKHGR